MKTLEEHTFNKKHNGDYMTLRIEKEFWENGIEVCRVRGFEQQLWQSKDKLAEWLRWCADTIERELK